VSPVKSNISPNSPPVAKYFLGMNRSLAQGKMFDEKARTKSRDTVPLALSVPGRVADL
jgi:hypothetical protein